jgi:glycosyltransferase involved in cell wall biosynthesis
MKISVITVVRNNRATIAAALDSVLTQTYAEVELIVIDGASSDGTLEVLAGYAGRLAVLVSEPDQGIYDALNKGIARASGEVIGFLHADDLLADRNVLATIATACSQPGVDGVYGDLLYVRKHQASQVVRYWQSGPFTLPLLAKGWMPPHPTLYLRRGIYEQFGAFDTRLRIAADYDFMLRILKGNTLHLTYIPAVLVKMRAGGASNRSVANLWRKSCEDLQVLRRHGIGGIFTLLRKNLAKLPQFVSRDRQG